MKKNPIKHFISIVLKLTLVIFIVKFASSIITICKGIYYGFKDVICVTPENKKEDNYE